MRRACAADRGWASDQAATSSEAETKMLRASVAFAAGLSCACAQDVITPVVTAVASLAGQGVEYTTYRLSVALGPSAESVYAIHGTPDAVGAEVTLNAGTPGPISLPAAFQAPTPFGVDVGGVDPALIAASPDAAFDSWLTVGLVDGDSSAELGAVGIDFGSWTETSGLEVIDGAIFAMMPDSFVAGMGSQITVAQLTIPATVSATVRMGMQGRTVPSTSTEGGQGIQQDWRVDGVSFEISEASQDQTTPSPPAAAMCSDVSCPEGQQLIADSGTTEQGATPEATCCEAVSQPVSPPSPQPQLLCSEWNVTNDCAPASMLVDEATTAQGSDTDACCRPVLCGEWDVTNDCDAASMLVDGAALVAGADADACCRPLLCSEWDESNDCSCDTDSCTVIIEDPETEVGADSGACCRREFCAEWDVEHDCDPGTLIIDDAAITIGSTATLCCDVVPPPAEPPAADPQELVVITLMDLSDDEAEAAAAAELHDALVATSGSEVDVEVVEISSAVAFPAMDPLPASFEEDFKIAMSSSIGGGGVFAPEQIMLSNGRRRRLQDTMEVEFTISAPRAMADTAASLVVAAASEPLEVTIGNQTISGAVSADPPIVETYVHCVGIWTPCGQGCTQFYGITRVATGIMGRQCDFEHLAERGCSGDYCAPASVLSGGSSGATAPTKESGDTLLYVGVGLAGVMMLLCVRLLRGGKEDTGGQKISVENPLTKVGADDDDDDN